MRDEEVFWSGAVDVAATGTVAECLGSGLGGGTVWFGPLIIGTVAGRVVSPSILICGIWGPSPGRFKVSTGGAGDMLSTGTAGDGVGKGSSSGRLIVGTAGAETVTAGMTGVGLGNGLWVVGDSVSLMTGLHTS